MTTRSHPRTLTQAFGPYTDRKLYPMGSDKKRKPRVPRMSKDFWTYLTAALVVGGAAIAVVTR